MYHTGSDTLGVLIARVSGQPFETFLKECIFEPLGMRDTGFFVPAAKLGGSPAATASTRSAVRWSFWMTVWTASGVARRHFLRAAVGWCRPLTITWRFGRMLLNKGKLGSERILARPTVELMLTDQITPAQKAISPFSPGFWENRGWGLGLSIITGRQSSSMGQGQFGWSRRLRHRLGFRPQRGPRRHHDDPAIQHGSGKIHEDFRTLVYQSLDD